MAPISEEQFRTDAMSFLESHSAPSTEETSTWGEGSDRVGIFPERTREQELAELAAARAWRGQVFDAGFGWVSGPA
ncbi:MAG: acyl-CoA dehydrogenase family protein, partial [Acidimicrobiales bacterium]